MAQFSSKLSDKQVYSSILNELAKRLETQRSLSLSEQDELILLAENIAELYPGAFLDCPSFMKEVIVKTEGRACVWVSYAFALSATGVNALLNMPSVQNTMRVDGKTFLEFINSTQFGMTEFCKGLAGREHGDVAVKRGLTVLLGKDKDGSLSLLAYKLFKMAGPEAVAVMAETIAFSDDPQAPKVIGKILKHDQMNIDGSPTCPVRGPEERTAFLAGALKNKNYVNDLVDKNVAKLNLDSKDARKPLNAQNMQLQESFKLAKSYALSSSVYAASVIIEAFIRIRVPKEKLVVFISSLPPEIIPNIFNGYSGVPEASVCRRVAECLTSIQAGYAIDVLRNAPARIANNGAPSGWEVLGNSNGALAQILKDKNPEISDRTDNFITAEGMVLEIRECTRAIRELRASQQEADSLPDKTPPASAAPAVTPVVTPAIIVDEPQSAGVIEPAAASIPVEQAAAENATTSMTVLVAVSNTSPSPNATPTATPEPARSFLSRLFGSG